MKTDSLGLLTVDEGESGGALVSSKEAAWAIMGMDGDSGKPALPFASLTPSPFWPSSDSLSVLRGRRMPNLVSSFNWRGFRVALADAGADAKEEAGKLNRSLLGLPGALDSEGN